MYILSVEQSESDDVAVGLDDLFGSPAAPSLVAAPPSEALVCDPPSLAVDTQAAELKRLEDEILATSMNVVEASVRFFEIAPDMEEPPESWVAEFGREKAEQRLRIMKSSWMSAKDAPVGLAMARATMLGITKQREAAKLGGNVLNVVLQAVFNAPQYPSIDVSGEG